MSRSNRLDVAGLLIAAILTIVLLLVFASRSCPARTELDPCPSAGWNRAVVVALASGAAALLVAPFAFLAEFALRRRIVYRGAWARAARRGLLAAFVVASLAGLRLGGALSPPVVAFLLVAPVVLEGYLTKYRSRA